MQPSRPAPGKTGLSFGRKLVGDEAPLLELRSINKSFPGVRALTNMSISFRRAAVHVICGENGAGKSTLMKSNCQTSNRRPGTEAGPTLHFFWTIST
jgi:ABC-type molybdenum transport system ATPase subunit/photorepair protein PhrA